ncbi:MAG: SsrA-binding protein SmpB [Bacteroidales bacterium]|nr:SsrA-binding protein SmpB [Bacteroidales bacterium]
MKKQKDHRIFIKNKKASYEYIILEKYIAGIVLKGTEIKSIRQGKVSINEAYCTFEKGELFVKNMNINPYEQGSYNNHLPIRDRKLLLTRRELARLQSKVLEAGLTIVPLSLFINEKGLAKLEIALVRGKKAYDKRETIRRRDEERYLARSHDDF